MRARELLNRLTIEDGRVWGSVATEVQRADADAVLEGAEPFHCLTRSRGYSKTLDLSLMADAVLLTATDRLRLYWLAADQEQGRLFIDNTAALLGRTPRLADRLEVQSNAVIARESGATLKVMAADAPSTWGLSPHWVFIDELPNWEDTPRSRRLWEAASSAAAKRADCRMVALGTPSTPDHFSFKILEHARTDPRWRVSEHRGPAPWIDPGRLEEQRRRLPETVYRQLFEGEWVVAEGALFDAGLVEAAFTLEGPGEPSMYRSYVAGLDLGAVRDRTAFALGHREPDGSVALDRMVVWRGSRQRPVDFAQVEETIVAAHRRWDFSLWLDPWQGMALAQRLRERGVPTTEFSFSQASKQRLASTLVHSLNAGGLHLYRAEGLRDELLGLRLAQSASGMWAFDHQRSGHDDMTTALALMLVAALDAEANEEGVAIETLVASEFGSFAYSTYLGGSEYGA